MELWRCCGCGGRDRGTWRVGGLPWGVDSSGCGESRPRHLLLELLLLLLLGWVWLLRGEGRALLLGLWWEGWPWHAWLSPARIR